MKKIIIISPDQYGYQTDDYNRVKFMKDKYDITFICFDLGKVKKLEGGIKIIYIRYNGWKSKYELLGMLKSIVSKEKIDFIYLRYFFNCWIFRNIIKKTPCSLDIRTGAVSDNSVLRAIYNIDIRITSLMFKNITIISESLANRLKISESKYKIIKLGANRVVKSQFLKKDINSMNLIYVGILDGRKIEDTIMAFRKFYEVNNTKISMSYTIIGYSISKENEERIRDLVVSEDNVPIEFLGRIDNEKLGEYFEKADIGISYIPITKYFDCQPPTKSYEYLMNGLICLATKTRENMKIINNSNGCLVEDNEQDFYNGLQYIMNNIKKYNRVQISNTVIDNSWENIICNSLIPYIEKKQTHK